MCDYAQTCADFRWSDAQRELSGLPDGRGLNIAYEAVDRHAKGPHAYSVALRWLSKSGDRRDLTYADLRRLSNRFANALRTLSV